MARFIVRRLVSVVPVLLLVAVFAFFLVHLTPGDPAAYMLGPLATPAQIDHLREALNLNVSLPIQFERWFLGALQGNLGESLFMSIPVPLAIWQRTEPTFLLTLMAVAIEVVIGVSAGVVAATRRNTWVDQLAIAFTSLGLSIPSFWLGLNLIFFFGVNLRVLPVAGYVPLGVSWIGAIRSLLMPACALGFISSALVARMTRASMLEVLSQDFVRTARAKGLREPGVVFRHALRNALLPVVTVLGIQFGRLLGGAVITEAVFAYPGLGRLVVTSIQNRDYPVVQGALMLVVVIFLLTSIVVDLSYAYLDPRVTLREAD